MLKKVGIAVACGIAVYGLVKLVARNVVFAPDPSVPAPAESAGNTNLSEASGYREHVSQDVSAVTEGAAEIEPSAVGVDAQVVKQIDPAGEAPCA